MQVGESRSTKYNNGKLKINKFYNIIKLDGFSIPVTENSKFKFVDLSNGLLIGEYNGLDINTFTLKNYDVLSIKMSDDLLTIGVIKKEDL